MQGCDENERVISYFSRKLSAAEQKYQTTERQCLAVINAIEKFRPYIEGIKFTVITDHASLQWLQNLRDGITASGTQFRTLAQERQTDGGSGRAFESS